jgi:hypothetical protein
MIRSEFRAIQQDFPKLMQYDSCGDHAVFLMTETKIGICLQTNIDKWYVGGTYDIKVEVYNFHGELVLKNEY